METTATTVLTFSPLTIACVTIGTLLFIYALLRLWHRFDVIEDAHATELFVEVQQHIYQEDYRRAA